MFISGVDKGSLSDQSGLCIGDQILSVNGIDFRHITHKDAVQLLRNINQMSFHLRQINKLPKPKNLIKQINKKSLTTPSTINYQKPEKDVQLSTNRLRNSKKTYLHFIFDENDQIKMKNSLREYLEETISIDQLIKYLLQTLNEQNQQNRVESNYFPIFQILFFCFRLRMK
jgi:C-terminal processing protease CtpA/Prc